MARIPKKRIKLGNHWYKLTGDPLLGEDGTYGGLFLSESEIKYDPNQTKTHLNETFVHECMEHLVCSFAEFDLTEHQLDIIAEKFTQLMEQFDYSFAIED